MLKTTHKTEVKNEMKSTAAEQDLTLYSSSCFYLLSLTWADTSWKQQASFFTQVELKPSVIVIYDITYITYLKFYFLINQ